MQLHQLIQNYFGSDVCELFVNGDYSASPLVLEQLIGSLEVAEITELNLSSNIPTFTFEDKEYSLNNFIELLAHEDFILWHDFFQSCIYNFRKIQTDCLTEDLNSPAVFDYLMNMLQFDNFPMLTLGFNDILEHLREVAPETEEIFDCFKKYRFGEWNGVVQNPSIKPPKKYKKVVANVVTLVSTNVEYFKNFSHKNFKGSATAFLERKQEIREAFSSEKNTIIFMIKGTKDFKLRQLV